MSKQNINIAAAAVLSRSSGSTLANMAPSSSGSWDGAGADIIDLDRYMRGSVRPSRALSEESQHCEQLVVDCGKPNVDITATRYKHYSHDSGVSDGSYRQRRPRRPHRRTSNPTSPPTTYREPPSVLSATPRTPQRSSDSLRQFRTACEQVLVDQQKQIARVAEVCERLERAENGRTTEGQSSGQSVLQKPKEERSDIRMETSERIEKQSLKSKTPSRAKSTSEKKKMEVIASRQSSETSDLSSSTSRSSSDRDVRKTDKHRTSYAEECKTYKIIMRKLDELNRRFGPQQQRARRPPSSSSVSVCDKLVATDPSPREVKTILARDSIVKERLSRSRVVTDTKVSPVELPMMNGVRERIITTNNCSVKYESSSCRSVTGEEYPSLTPFDLNDPMRLYAQAKHLQAMAATATTRRTHSVDVDSRTPEQRTDAAERQFPRTIPSARSHSRSERDRSPSLCAVCRAYLRSLRQCLIAPLTDCKVANT